MTLLEFETLVCNYMNRDITAFNVGVAGQDKIVDSLNKAMQWAQRMAKFEALRDQGYVAVSQTTPGNLKSITSTGGGTFEARSIDHAFLKYSSGLFPLKLLSRNEQVQRATNNLEGIAIADLINYTASSSGRPYAVQRAFKLELWPWVDGLTSPVDVYLDYIQRFPDYANGANPGGITLTDPWTAYCADWVLYRTAFHANFYLKDDQRAALNAEVIKEAWESVLAWNDSLIEGSFPVDE